MTRLRPDPALLERFTRDLAALGAVEGPLAVAVSGGPDSLALLLLAAAGPMRVLAATVDHQLRAESPAEAAFVAGVCRALGVPHATLTVAVTRDGDGLQAAARQARYAALAPWMDRQGATALLTAHHADDQAETLLMRLQRGSGVGGLAGVRARGGLPGSGGRLTVLRPLLGWRRAQLAAIVAAAGLEAVDDPSNSDCDFDRVRMRAHIAGAPWLDIPALARSAAALAEAEDALEATASALFTERARLDGTLCFDPTGLPPELQRRLTLRCLRSLVPTAAPRGEQLTALLTALTKGEVMTLAAVKCSGGDRWRFELAPPRKS
ncbi:MAG TPA: tRNA lysidine(34) synthetase TilS [Allosphingosinicella sp.]|jgi:tRNA(Ile)-lysidine synthase